MRVCVLAGGGLASWYVANRLAEEGHAVSVWLADVGQVDEQFKELFVTTSQGQTRTLHLEDRQQALAAIGLEAARFLGRQPNGYWNTTGLLRVVLVSSVNDSVALRDDGLTFAHGCVGFGNDQKRFERLFGSLNKSATVYAPLATWTEAGEKLTRAAMVDYVEKFSSLSVGTLARKVSWSSDGSIIGAANEGTHIESVEQDWTIAPFVMTGDPLRDVTAEEIVVEINRGQLIAVNEFLADNAHGLLSTANRLGGLHGIGRLAVMEDRLSGHKCRGVYEAPGLTVLGAAFQALYEATLATDEYTDFRQLSALYASSVYAGEYFSRDAHLARQRLTTLTSKASGKIRAVLRAGLIQIISVTTSSRLAQVERRFDSGGVAWQTSTSTSGIGCGQTAIA